MKCRQQPMQECADNHPQTPSRSPSPAYPTPCNPHPPVDKHRDKSIVGAGRTNPFCVWRDEFLRNVGQTKCELDRSNIFFIEAKRCSTPKCGGCMLKSSGVWLSVVLGPFSGEFFLQKNVKIQMSWFVGRLKMRKNKRPFPIPDISMPARPRLPRSNRPFFKPQNETSGGRGPVSLHT